MGLTRQLVISALIGVGLPVLALAVVSLTDEHSSPRLLCSFTECVANVAFWPATFLLRMISPGFFCRDEADLTPMVVSLSAASLFAIPAVFWGTVVFCLSLAWRALKNRINPRVIER
jgi:hypothetical protein